MPAQIRLRGPALQGREAQPPFGIDPQQESHKPVAEAALSIEEEYRPWLVVLCARRHVSTVTPARTPCKK
jgi:hypothetical protein